MALRVELDKATAERAFNMLIASAQRAKNSKTANPLLNEIHDKDIRAVTAAMASMTEIK